MNFLTLTYTAQFYLISLLFAALLVSAILGLTWLFKPVDKTEEAKEAQKETSDPFPVVADPVDYAMLSSYYLG